MSKLDEAKEILGALQVPAKQQNAMCCCVLLAMANLLEGDSWKNATNSWIRIHDVIVFSNNNYGTTYAENSRETFRKQAIHHFRNAAFIEDNDEATNSPNYRYRLTDETLHLIQSYGKTEWDKNLAEFIFKHESLVQMYASKRSMKKMPVKVNGVDLTFLPASTINCKRLLLRNLLLALLPTPNVYMLVIPSKKIWLKTKINCES